VGEASRFALFRTEQTEAVRLRLRPLQGHVYNIFVKRFLYGLRAVALRGVRPYHGATHRG